MPPLEVIASVKAITYGVVTLVGGIFARLITSRKQRQDAFTEQITKERDQYRIELELCRFTYIECFLRLQQMHEKAQELLVIASTTDEDFSSELPDISDLPASVSELFAELRAQTKSGACDAKSH